MNPQIVLKPGRDKPVLAHHPWIFSGAIARADSAPDGETVDVLDFQGRWLARGYFNSQSQIAVRLWTWDQAEEVDRGWLRARLERAIAARAGLEDARETNVMRLVNAESDFLPGLIVDQYADWLVLQSLTAGIEKWKGELVELLRELAQPRGIYERSDLEVREKEGLRPQVGVLHGEEPPERIEVRESGLRFLVDVKRGHKTGFYIDQRENRRLASRLIASLPLAIPDKEKGRPVEVLNAFSYTGAFAVYACAAARQDVRVIDLDSSRDALDLAMENMQLNGFPSGECVEGDAFQMLRRYRDQGQSFDAVLLDPPKFVFAQSQLQSGLRGYKDINLLAFKLLRPGGLLVTFSCSGPVSAELFQKVVFGAAMDAARDAHIVAKLLQAPDHPILLSFPESEYLKGLACRLA